MNAPDLLLPIATATIDADGRLIAADPRIFELNLLAGGDLGAPVALPQLADIARLTRRLGITLSRGIVVADGEDDVELWVRAEPGAAGQVSLEITGWRQRSPWRQVGDADEHERDHLRSEADFVWETDAALRITTLSAEAGVRFGFDAVALAGQPITRLFALAEAADGELPMLRGISGQGRFDDQIAEIRGTGRQVVLSASPRTDPVGRFAGLVGAAVRLSDPAPTPTSASATAMPDGFVDKLGSALRGPLDRIIANADSISAQADGPLREDYVEYAGDIAQAGRHLLGLVEDLADLNAIERSDFHVEAETIDLADVARRAAGLLSVRASQNAVAIDRPGFDAMLLATGEFRRALQILVNLIGNAVRYSPRGTSVGVALSRDDGRASVTVIDTGKGIAPADQERIFEKFARVDPGEIGGSGLGLYIARRLARAMGGDLTVQSAPGEGARFTLTLPAV